MLSNNMQQQYWLTKKSVLRKLGGKEDECIISSDAELDAKLELFKSINETCIQLQRVIDLYQEKLCCLAQEENALGRYLKEHGKNEKNENASQLMCTAGKSLAYISHQRLTLRPPLVRLHHDVETFRGRAISDTRVTVTEMEKARTEYRAALSWMKSVSSQLDPDTGFGLDKFRKAQTYVKTSKTKFDRYTLACLQKVDLLAAARCNMFSHALVAYQNTLESFALKASETLSSTATKLSKTEAYDFTVITSLADSPKDISDKQIDQETEDKKTDDQIRADKDRETFFNAEYTDKEDKVKTPVNADSLNNKSDQSEEKELITNLLGEDFSFPSTSTIAPISSSQILEAAPILLDLDYTNSNSSMSELFLNKTNFMPSTLWPETNQNFNFDTHSQNLSKINAMLEKTKEGDDKKINTEAKNSTNMESRISWLNIFAELDPLANGVLENNTSGDRA